MIGTPSPRPRWLAAIHASRVRRRPNKTTRWDRPIVRDWRWVVHLIGRSLIVIGLLMFGFVAYQLWGTGIETARHQNQLENEFEALLAQQSPDPPSATTDSSTPPPTTPGASPGSAEPGTTTTPGGSTGATTPVPASPTTTRPAAPTPTAAPPADIPQLEMGGALGKIEIPRTGLDFWIVGGVQPNDLKAGIGHYPDTPLPGQVGNSALAGHRTTYGSPLYNIDDVEPGDEIIVTTLDGRFVYRVTGQQIVSPSDYWVITNSDPGVATLTVTSCHPRFSASQRIVVTAELDASGGDAPITDPVRDYAPAANEAPSKAAPGTTDASTSPRVTGDRPDTNGGGGRGSGGGQGPPAAGPDDPTLAAPGEDGGAGDVDGDGDGDVVLSEQSTNAFQSSWFSDSSAFVDVALWTMVVAAIAAIGYLVGWYFKRTWVGYLVAFAPFLFTLYFFYQNVNRLLPAAL